MQVGVLLRLVIRPHDVQPGFDGPKGLHRVPQVAVRDLEQVVGGGVGRLQF